MGCLVVTNMELTGFPCISLLFLTLRQIHLAFLPMTDTQEDERLWWLTGFYVLPSYSCFGSLDIWLGQGLLEKWTEHSVLFMSSIYSLWGGLKTPQKLYEKLTGFLRLRTALFFLVWLPRYLARSRTSREMDRKLHIAHKTFPMHDKS